jgi:FkbM family methyltransferase
MENKTFIEVGACDFDTCIPLLQNGWRGVMVEPVERIANSLESKLIDYDNVALVRDVISDYDGEIEFIESIDRTDWVRGISHVNSSNHKGARMLDWESNYSFRGDTSVKKCMTLDSLVTLSGFSKIDYLKVDVEGHETNVLEAYSWNIKPTFIKLEHSHIDDKRMRILLETKGYMVYVERNDIYAIY